MKFLAKENEVLNSFYFKYKFILTRVLYLELKKKYRVLMECYRKIVSLLHSSFV